MRINWFSPLPPAETAIANYTLDILPALSKVCEVTLWTTQQTWHSSLKKYATVRTYRTDPVDLTDLKDLEELGGFCIYHLGNRQKFHRSILQVSGLYPGIVILHDMNLQNLSVFSSLSLTKSLKNFFFQQIQKNECDLRTNEWLTQCNALQNILGKANGFLVHSKENYETLKTVATVPVAFANLAYPSTCSLRKQPGSSPPYRLIIFGFLGFNRRLHKVLKALSTFVHHHSFFLDVYGKMSFKYRYYIKTKLLFSRVSKMIKWHGYVSDEDLKKALNSADLAINLRYPSMGEASYSQLQIWNASLPSLVTFTGWYKDLPQDTVAFVRPAHELEDIHNHLVSFLKDPEKFIEMGKRGYVSLRRNHSPEHYVDALMNLLEKIQMQKVSTPEKGS